MAVPLFSAGQRRVLAGLFTNLTAGWVGAIIIAPNFSDIFTFSGGFILLFDALAAIVCLVVAFYLEEI